MLDLSWSLIKCQCYFANSRLISTLVSWRVWRGITLSLSLSLPLFFWVRPRGQVVAHRPDIVITRAPLHDDLTAPAECLYTSAPKIMWESNLHSDIVSPPVSPSASPLASDASCQLKLPGELQTVSSSITSDTSGSHLSLAVMSETPHDGERLGVRGGRPTYKPSPASRGSSCRLWHSELWSRKLCSPHHCSPLSKIMGERVTNVPSEKEQSVTNNRGCEEKQMYWYFVLEAG